LGIEALSRGASHCDFVDIDRDAHDVIIENLRQTGFSQQGNVVRGDAVKYVGNTTETYDIVFADPYYAEVHFKFLLENIQNILKPGAIIFFSHGHNTNMAEEIVNATRLKLLDTRKYGEAHISIIKLVN
jgi:16S rRNA G966 N2-methylase RsmD